MKNPTPIDARIRGRHLSIPASRSARYTIRVASFAALTACFLPAFDLRGQAVTPAKSAVTVATDEKAILLDVFEVTPETGDGYRAANTHSGTRYNMAIRDIPVSVDVVTEGFMRDIGAADYRQAMEYIVGLQQDVGDPARNNDKEAGGGFIRGLQVSNMRKDGFQRSFVGDPIGAQRIEVLKGPGGPIYGQDNIGGAINLLGPALTNRPSFYALHRIGTYGYSRSEMRVAGPLLQRGVPINFSLGAAYENRKYEADFDHLHAFTFNPKLDVQLGPKTKVVVEVEMLRRKWAHLDNGLVTDPNTALGVDIPGRTGAKVIATPDFRRFRWNGPDPHNNRRGYSQMVMIKHAFTPDLQLSLAGNRQGFHFRTKRYGAPQVRLQNAAQIPVNVRTDLRFLALLRSDGRVLEFTQSPSEFDGIQGGDQYRGELYYSFRTGSLLHRVNAGSAYQRAENAGDHNKFDWDYTNLPVDVALRRYRSLTDFNNPIRWIAEIPGTYRTQWQQSKTYSTEYYANITTNAFENRLTTMFGALHTRNDAQRRNLKVGDDSLINVVSMRKSPARYTTPSVNFSYRVVPSTTAYLNFSSASSSGQSNFGRDGNGEILKIKESNNRELGAKTEVWSDRVWATAAVFSNTVSNERFTVPFAYNNQIESTTGFGADVLMDTRSKGAELKIDWRLTNSWMLNANYQYLDLGVSRIGDLVEPDHPNPTIRAAQLAAKPRDASIYLGKNTTNVSRDMVRAFTKYEFVKGRLKGLWAFAGAKYDGARESVSSFSTDPEAPPTIQSVPSKIIYDLNVGYRHKMGRYRIEHLLKTENLTNYEEWYFNNFYRGRTVHYSVGLSF